MVSSSNSSKSTRAAEYDVINDWIRRVDSWIRRLMASSEGFRRSASMRR